MYAGGANVVGRESKLATITHYGEKHLKFYAGDQALSPTYCPALFDEILHFHSHGQPEGHGCEFALDVGTGSGVVAALLAGHFRRVMAIDCDPEPLKRAQPKDNIEYRVARAEALPVPDHSVDLIAVGMALQWFDVPKFLQEAKRALKPGGTLACFAYRSPCCPDYPSVTQQVRLLACVTLRHFWDPRICHVEAGYRLYEMQRYFSKVKYVDSTDEKPWVTDTATSATLRRYCVQWPPYMLWKRRHPNVKDCVEAMILPSPETMLRLSWIAHLVLCKP